MEFLSLALILALQDPVYVETRFHRVHLRNGNFVDGDMVRRTDQEVVLKLKFGEMSVRSDSVDRVELIKMRTIGETPKEIEKPAPKVLETESRPPAEPTGKTAAPPPGKTPVAAAPVKAPDKEPEKAVRTVDTFEAGGGVREKVDQILAQIKQAPRERKFDYMQSLLAAGPDAAPYLASILETLDPATLGYVSNALSRMQDPKAVPILRRLLASPAPGVRTACVTLIGKLGGTENARDLHPLLRDDDVVVRGTAVSVLQDFANKDSFDPVSLLISDPDKSVRMRAIAALTAIADKHGLKEELARALSDALERGRGEAKADILSAIDKAGARDLWILVVRYLTDDSPQVRAAAAIALGNFNVPDVAETILDRLSFEKEYWPRIQLAGAAQKMKLQKSIDILIEWLKEPDKNIKTAAARSLREITGQGFGLEYEPWAAWREQTRKKE